VEQGDLPGQNEQHSLRMDRMREEEAARLDGFRTTLLGTVMARRTQRVEIAEPH
jgi:hypothetical protein